MGTPAHTSRSASDPEPSVDMVRARFLAACESSGDGSPPDLDEFLTPFEEPERSQLRSELERLVRVHERSRSDSGSRVSPTRSDQTLETRKDPPQEPAQAASAGVASPMAYPPDRTIDHNDLPEARNDHFSVSEATGELPRNLSDETGALHFNPSDETGALISNPSDETGPEVQFASDETGAHTQNVDGNLDFSVASRPGEMPDASDATGAHQPAADGTGDYNPTADASVAPQQKAKKRGVAVPTSVAGYEILAVLGRGAMGVVYKARQRGLKRLVALKMILSGEHASAQDIGRFQAEANAVAQLQHAGIVQIYEVGEDEGRPFFSLEFVDGPSLHKKLQGNPLPPKEAAALLQKMAEAMGYAHARGVIHRDLKPANVLLTSDGVPKIGDFGLAKRLEDDESGLTRTGAVLGTPSYMSPEQAAGLNDQVGPLADQYSLGAMLYDMLTGRPPFRGTSIMDTLQQLRTREPVPPMQLQPGVPRDLETICLKCLEKEKNKRYVDCEALAADLGRFLKGEPILARPISVAEKVWRWCLNNKLKASYIASAIVAVFAFMIGLIVFNVKVDHERTVALDARNNESVAKEEAQRQATIAQEKREEAERLAIIANQRKEEAEKQTLIANQKTDDANREMEAQRKTAQESLAGMTKMVGAVYDVLQSKRFSTTAGQEVLGLRNVVLNQMNQFMINEANKINAKAKVTYTDLLAHQLLADLMIKFGKGKEARELLENGHKIATERLQREPGNDKTRANLSVFEERFGDLAIKIEGDARTAKARYLQARALRDEVRLHPVSNNVSPSEIKRLVAHDDIGLGSALIALGQGEEAARYLEEASTLFNEWDQEDILDARAKKRTRTGESRSNLQYATLLIGVAASNHGDYPSAEKQIKDALARGEKLLQEYSNFADYKADQAEAELAYGDLLLRQGKSGDAAKHYDAAKGYLKQWFDKFPDDTSKQAMLALAIERLGAIEQMQGRKDDAQKNYKEALQLRKELYQLQPNNKLHVMAYLVAMARAGDYDKAAANCNAVRGQMSKSTELMLQIARAYAVCARDGARDRQKLIEQALSALKAAVGDDFKDAAILATDPDLSVLRDEPAFKELIAKMKKR